MMINNRSDFPTAKHSPGPSRSTLGSNPLYNAKYLEMPTEEQHYRIALLTFLFLKLLTTLKVFKIDEIKVCVCMCVCVCVCAHTREFLTCDSSETVKVISIKLGMVTASDMRMHRVLIILTLTFIQGHTHRIQIVY